MTKLFSQTARSKSDLRDASPADLRRSASMLKARLRELTGAPEDGAFSTTRIVQNLENTTSAIEAIQSHALSEIERLEANRIAAGDEYRLLGLTHKTIRKPLQPDSLRTSLVVMACTLAEASASSAVMIAGGTVDVATGAGLSLSMAGTTTVIGLMSGYGLRYINRRKSYDIFEREEKKTRLDRPALIRALAWSGLAIGATAMATIIWVGARMRSLGETTGVFDLERLSVAATLDDGLSVLVVGLSAASAVWSVKSGFTGFTDPIPGYSAAYDRATSEIEATAEDLIEDTLEHVEDASEDAILEAENRLEEAMDSPAQTEVTLLEIARDIDAHNDALRAARDAAEAAANKRWSISRFILGRGAEAATPFDASAFDALILPKIDDLIARHRAIHGADADPVRDAISKLEAVQGQCEAQLRTALAGFAADTPNLDALMDDEGVTHGTS